MKPWYLDTSALLKLILLEAERPALEKFIQSDIVSSRYARLEVLRNLRGEKQSVKDGSIAFLERFSYVDLSSAILSMAEVVVRESELRAPDAIHVASALFLRQHTEGMITYDKQMAKVARRYGIRVESPA